jgi:hypothetical protein
MAVLEQEECSLGRGWLPGGVGCLSWANGRLPSGRGSSPRPWGEEVVFNPVNVSIHGGVAACSPPP